MRVNKIPSGMETNIDSSIFVKKGVPDPKTCMVRFFKTDKSGSSQVLVAEYEINLAMHFGDQFAEQVYDLPRVGNDPDLNVQSVKIKALMSCQKEKESNTNLLQNCIDWRQQQGPPSQTAIPVVSRRQTEKQPAAAAATAN